MPRSRKTVNEISPSTNRQRTRKTAAQKLTQKQSEAHIPPTSKDQTDSNLFAGSTTTSMASALPIWEASSILTQKQDIPWENDANGKLCYTKDVENGKGAVLFWVTDDLEQEYPATLAGAAALAVIDAFDIRAACMHLIYAAYVTQLDRPWEREFVLDDRQIEDYLGLKRRTDKNRKQKLALIKEIAQQPCQITTFVSYPAGGKARGFTISQSRLWNMLEIQHHYNTDLFGNEELVGLTFRVRAGQWAKYLLNEEGRANSNTSYQTSLLSKALLKDVMQVWQQREGAARLMIWLLFKTDDDIRYPLTVQSFMEIAYGSIKIEAAKSDSRLRNKLVNAWDDDLLALHERDWKIHFHAQSYPPELQPFAFGRVSPSRPRNFFEQLLLAQIWICPPSSFNRVSVPKTKQQTLPEGHFINGTQVKELRNQRGWSQRELATRAGLSQSLIGRIETDCRKITLENQKILTRVFQEPNIRLQPAGEFDDKIL